jgi:2-polyprenyl-3-methyl-5-hydroxy-6-metoxy-1,4-benzoquinol methylase
MSDHAHSHSHGHQHHQHGHNHQHGQHKAHSHSSSKTTDQWVGKDYLNYPGLYVPPLQVLSILIDSRELAKTNHETTLRTLVSAGISEEEIKTLNLLEVGCGESPNSDQTTLISGAGAVTQLFSKSFKSVHAIDVSPSMLSTFSTELPSEKYPNVTYSLNTLSSSSPEEFAKGTMKSPIEGDPNRVVSLPRSKWDVAAVILVLHHVDDIEGFMTGLTGLVEDGGWVVFAEFTNLGQGHKVSKSIYR